MSLISKVMTTYQTKLKKSSNLKDAQTIKIF